MENCLTLLKRDKLMLLARRIPAEVLIDALTVCADMGVTVFESTFDHLCENPVEENREKLKKIKAALGNRLCLGAGTVLTVEEVRAAFDAGAEFIVSPDSDPEIIAETKRLGMISLPGAMTPTEVKRAWSLGADMVKLFPADDLGLHYIQNLKGPLGHIPLLATGGVNPVTIPQLLNAGITAVGTGVTVFRPDLVAAKDYEAIGVLTKMHVDAIRLNRK